MYAGYWVRTNHVNDHARLYRASLRAVERVSEVGRDGKLVTRHFQLWVGAARVQKPLCTLHADWEDVFLDRCLELPTVFVSQNARRYIREACSKLLPVCRRCFCLNARPPAYCSMAPFQNLEFFAVEMFSRLYRHTNAQRKDAVPVAAVGVAALQPCELVLGDVRLLAQSS